MLQSCGDVTKLRRVWEKPEIRGKNWEQRAQRSLNPWPKTRNGCYNGSQTAGALFIDATNVRARRVLRRVKDSKIWKPRAAFSNSGEHSANANAEEEGQP